MTSNGHSASPGGHQRQAGSGAAKTAAQLVEEDNLTGNEHILRRCYELYNDSDRGVANIAEAIGITLRTVPCKKIMILLIGNHSAGKSSFINWYIEEHVQRTGVAIETPGFVLVTSGKKRETLTGNATLHLHPHLEPLRQILGVVDYLTTEMSTSQAKMFNLVTFIDSPGLVDGEMTYPFDVNKSISWLGERANLIFVFFEPIGQALCKRTLDMVEALHDKHAEKIRFYLSKADQAGEETDRQKVMMQIVQALCKRKGLNRTCFDMPTIYVPSLAAKPERCVNQIQEVSKEIEKTICATIQNTLNTLERDCDVIATRVEALVSEYCAATSLNFNRTIRRCIFYVLAAFFPLWMSLAAVLAYIPATSVSLWLGKPTAHAVHLAVGPAYTLHSIIPAAYAMHTIIGLISIWLLVMIICANMNTPVPTLPRRDLKELAGYGAGIKAIVKQKEILMAKYLAE